MKETFFLQIPPGLEDLAQKELELKFPSLAPHQGLPTCVKEHGGLSMELPLTTGLMLNYWLKIPNRILLRFAHFKCRDIPKFYNKVSKLNWAPYYAGQELNFHISSHKSRLFDDRKISKALQDGLSNFLKRQEPKEKAKRRVQTTRDWHLFCRFEEDWCTLSIDTSGPRLGLRGYKADVGKAPLRENLAAALFLFTSLSEREGPYHPQKNKALTLVDPFCGSGTILLETALFYEPNLFRNYAFEFFPSWEMKKSPLKDLKRPTGLNLDLPYFLVGSDIEKARIETIEKNFRAAGVIGEEEDHIFQEGDILDKDFCQRMSKNIFGLKNNEDLNVHAWCLTNPPYGERIKRPLTGPELLENLNNWGSWQRIGILLPKEQKLPESFGNYQKNSSLHFENGGLEVTFTLYELMIKNDKPSSSQKSRPQEE